MTPGELLVELDAEIAAHKAATDGGTAWEADDDPEMQAVIADVVRISMTPAEFFITVGAAFTLGFFAVVLVHR